MSDLEVLLDSSSSDWTITRGWASVEEQQALYEKFLAGGPRAAPPSKSAHCRGAAVDLVPDGDPNKEGLQPDWDTTHPVWQWLFGAVAAHPRLHSGVSFKDADHIEMVGWDKLPAPMFPEKAC